MQAATGTALRAKASKVYARQSREALEQRLILDHLPLVRHVVSKVRGSLSYRGDEEDLISAGTLGLVKAARAFDPTRHSEFKTYAYIRVRGAILDELRGRSFVPASVHGQLRTIRQAYEALAAESGSPPADEDLAARAGMSLRELYRTLSEARKQNFMSIHGLDDDHPALGSFVPPDGGEAPDAEAERKEMLERLAAAIRQLSRRDRLVLLLYYERDLTMKETAQVLGITESRVSQIHASALFKLSMRLRNAT
ncbi:MAG: FliA/WhiG family RNA polymerase sigma factor [Phycisphaerae bacterium]